LELSDILLKGWELIPAFFYLYKTGDYIMAFNFSRGTRGFGDIKFESDADTGIDFDNDVIDLQANGSSVLKISGSDIFVNDGSDIRLGTDSYIFFDGYDTSNDCYISQDPNNSLKIDGNNHVTIIADQTVILQHNAAQKVFIDFTNDIAKFNMPMQINTTNPTITYRDSDGAEKATIGVNSSDNILFENKTANKHIVFKVLDQATVKEGLRLDGAVPEVVVNQTSDSLVDFRVESDNNEHMLFVDGSEDKIGIGTATPDYTLDVAGDMGVNQYIYHNGDGNTFINFTDNRIRLNAGGNNFIDCEDNAALKVRINNGGNNIDFIIKDRNNNVYFTADANTARIGIGTETPDVALDIDSDAIRIRNNNTPSSASDFGHKGEIRWDTNYLYICVATDTWKRVALSTW